METGLQERGFRAYRLGVRTILPRPQPNCLLTTALCLLVLLVLRELLLVADGQLPAALGAAPPEDGATTLARHPLQEPVLTQARNALWLVGSLWHPNAPSCRPGE
jgi:hypothetical protein